VGRREPTPEVDVRYVLLLYDENAANPSPVPPDPDALKGMFTEYGAFTQSVADAGALLAAEALQPVATATSVRVRDGRTVTTDGPFAETKEGLGGLYLIEAPDLDAALAWAARCPGARYGTVEVRPIIDRVEYP
jgi:hypothetical protein